MSPVAAGLMRVTDPGPPSFQQFRTDLSTGFALLDEYGSGGGHLQRRPNAAVDLTGLSPANWLMPTDSGSGAVKFAQTLPGGVLGMGLRPVLWWHSQFTAATWDHVSVWDAAVGTLDAFVEERVLDVNSHPKNALTNAIWLAPSVYYGRITSVDGSPPTVTITVYKTNQDLSGEVLWATRVVPSGEFNGATVVAAIALPSLIISGNGTVGLGFFAEEYDSGDSLLGTFRYAAAWDLGAVFLSETNPAALSIKGGYPGSGLVTASSQAGGANGLDRLTNPGFAASAGWPVSGTWNFEKALGYTALSLSPDRVTAAAVDTPSLSTQQIRVIWAAASATSGAAPDGDIDPALDPDGKSSPHFMLTTNSP